MPTKDIIPRRRLINGKVYYCTHVPLSMNGGKRKDICRRKLSDAQRVAAALTQERNAKLHGFAILTGSDRAKMGDALRLVGSPEKVLEACEQFARINPTQRCTVGELVSMCVSEKIRARFSKSYLASFRNTLRRFTDHFGPRLAHEITTQEVANWLHAGGWEPVTQRGYLTDIRTLFAYAVRHRYVGENPALAVERPKASQKAPGIFTVEEAAKFVYVVQEHDAGLLPYVALILFGGLRPEEAYRCRWPMIKGDVIDLPAGEAKNNKRRLIDFSAIAEATGEPRPCTIELWLAYGGELPPKNLRKRLRAARALAGVPWPHDVLRHSFCSYAVPVAGLAQTGLLADHSEAILRKHYRELVTRNTAEKFWRIVPKLGAPALSTP